MLSIPLSGLCDTLLYGDSFTPLAVAGSSLFKVVVPADGKPGGTFVVNVPKTEYDDDNQHMDDNGDGDGTDARNSIVFRLAGARGFCRNVGSSFNDL